MTNSILTTRFGCRTALLGLAATIGLSAFISSPVLADVVGRGDVTSSEPLNPIGGDVGDLIVGDDGYGELLMDQALGPDPLEADSAIFGNEFTGIGFAAFDGLQTEFFVRGGDLIVGRSGYGELQVNDRALVSLSPMLDMDGMPQGEAGELIVGQNFGSFGLIEVNGLGSILEGTDVFFGEFGQAYLSVTNKGTFRSETAVIGQMRGSYAELTFSGLGTRWINSGDVELGTVTGSSDDENASAVLTIADRAIVQIGEVETTTDPEEFDNGEFNINTLGRVEMAGGTLVTEDLTNNGLIRGSGVIQARGSFVIDPLGRLRNGDLNGLVTENLRVIDPEVEVVNNGTIESYHGIMEFEGPVTNNLELVARDANMFFYGGLTNATGARMIAGGDSTLHVVGSFISEARVDVLADSEVLVSGDLVLTASSILGLTVGDDAGTLNVSGEATIEAGALLELDYSAGVASQEGDSYKVFDAEGGITGTFSNPGSLVTADSRQWMIDYLGDEIWVTATGLTVTPLAGDLNGDDRVDGRDFMSWLRNPGGSSLGDVEGNFGAGVGAVTAVAAATAVPEPTSALLLMLAGANAAICVRRKRR